MNKGNPSVVGTASFCPFTDKVMEMRQKNRVLREANHIEIVAHLTITWRRSTLIKSSWCYKVIVGAADSNQGVRSSEEGEKNPKKNPWATS